MSIFQTSEPFQWRLYGDEFNHGRYFNIFIADNRNPSTNTNIDTSALVIDGLVDSSHVRLTLLDQDTPSYLQFWDFTSQ